MTIMGLDVGDRTIGVAVSDELLITAQGLTTLHRKNLTADLAALMEIIQEYEVNQIVVGLPKNKDGSLGTQSEKALSFVQQLERLNIPVVTWDERFTTQEAERVLIQAGLNWRKRREQVDKLAAVLILQGYLDCRRQRQPSESLG